MLGTPANMPPPAPHSRLQRFLFDRPHSLAREREPRDVASMPACGPPLGICRSAHEWSDSGGPVSRLPARPASAPNRARESRRREPQRLLEASNACCPRVTAVDHRTTVIVLVPARSTGKLFVATTFTDLLTPCSSIYAVLLVPETPVGTAVERAPNASISAF